MTVSNVDNPAVEKFVLVTATQLPHKCVACGLPATGREEFIDFQTSFDWEGALYLCINCGQQIARVLGFISPEEGEKLVEDTEGPVAGLLLELQEEREKNANLSLELDSLRHLLTKPADFSILAPLVTSNEELANRVLNRLEELGNLISSITDERDSEVASESGDGTSESDSSK